MKPAIVVENLGKRYRVNHQAEPGGYRTLRESLAGMATGAVRRWRNGGEEGTMEDFWALKDVSFEVKPGEVVGIIGRNGAGKSTLLKILSQITKPTTGRVQLNGRVGSLLEVGTGFHPELTGRENIFLNGAILGMRRSEIADKFDAIVDFSGVERFLDMPVKRYSSGMYVRLAFAVAAHLELELLVVDEVLAVGDQTFQQKCLGKMEDVTRSGRTVLFVSHNMAAVRALCSKGILMVDGQVRRAGAIAAITEEYLQAQALMGGAVDAGVLPCKSRCGKLTLQAIAARVDEKHLALALRLEASERLPLLGVGFAVRSLDGLLLASQGPLFNGIQVEDLHGTVELSVTIHDVLAVLNGGKYVLDIWMGYPGVEILLRVDQVVIFEVPESDLHGTGHALSQRVNGPCALKATYRELQVD